MSGDAASSRRPSLTVRLTPDEKRRFATIAAARGQSESELGLAAVRLLLDLNAKQISQATSARPKESTSDRITIRLRPGDRQTIAERARQRSTKASTYIAALVRAHVASNPPMTANELTAFKQAVAVLAGLRRADGARRQRSRPAWQPAAGLATRPHPHSCADRGTRTTDARVRARLAE